MHLVRCVNMHDRMLEAIIAAEERDEKLQPFKVLAGYVGALGVLSAFWDEYQRRSANRAIINDAQKR